MEFPELRDNRCSNRVSFATGASSASINSASWPAIVVICPSWRCTTTINSSRDSSSGPDTGSSKRSPDDHAGTDTPTSPSARHIQLNRRSVGCLNVYSPSSPAPPYRTGEIAYSTVASSPWLYRRVIAGGVSAPGVACLRSEFCRRGVVVAEGLGDDRGGHVQEALSG